MHPYVTVHGNGDEGVALASELTFALCRRHQHLLDKSTQHVLARWLGLGLLLSLYAVRVTVQIQGFYVVSYGLAIYILNLFVAFLSPKIDPALPMSASDEFRPFIRCPL